MSDNVVRYSGRTTHYTIPVFRPDHGDTGGGTTTAPKPSARSEQRAVNIEDSQMRGNGRSTLGNTFKTCVLNEGVWSVSGSTITLSSFEGYIENIYLNNRGVAINWTGIPTGISYDLFLGLIELERDVSYVQEFKSSKEYGDIQLKTYQTSQNFSNTNYMIMAQVTL